MNFLKAAALDIDGVLLKDTFSPVIKAVVEQFDGIYDRETERNVFSQNRRTAAEYLIQKLKAGLSVEEMLSFYFQEREKYIQLNGGGLEDGVGEMLNLLREKDLRIICYGGLSEEYFRRELGAYLPYFERYVCTNDFRPGVREITFDILRLPPASVLFIDDVSRVGEAAKEIGAAFIGMPTRFPWGFQKDDMKQTGIKYIISHLSDITPELLEEIDRKSGGA